jgi:uncharacterized protein YdbL (DUF1318 family)
MTNMTRRFFISLSAALLVTVIPFSPARAADRQTELRERFKNRLPDVRNAKSAGKIGETTAGVLEAVDAKAVESDAKLKKLVEEENADRKELFKIIAEKEKVTEEKVAERAGQRNFERAKSGEYLKDKSGKWTKKS